MSKRIKVEPADNGFVVTCEEEGGLKFDRKVLIASDIHEVAKHLVNFLLEKNCYSVTIVEDRDGKTYRVDGSAW